ncbi:MAG: hypothetical protein SPL08_02565 [Pseudomonadota bacterium]|nr:hypothetical protein [Pseudomonadota bacterium]
MDIRKLMNPTRNVETKEPVWMRITVGPTMGKAMGLKSKASSFYLVADERIPYEDTSGIPDYVKENLREKKPDFRGVYCSPDVGSLIPDILADLQKYCDVTGQPGLTFIGGKEYNLQPQSSNAQLQKKMAAKGPSGNDGM